MRAELDEVAAAEGRLQDTIRSANEDLRRVVRAARDAGASWTDIGDVLRISRQSAWARFGSTCRGDNPAAAAGKL